MLFEENKERINTETSRGNKTNFEYLDQSCLEEHALIRKLLNDCFSQVSNFSKSEIKSRIESPIEDEFHAVCFELLIGCLFRKIGCTMQEHPDIPGTNKHPDFLVTLPSGDSFYLELVTISEYDDSSITRFEHFIKKLRNESNFKNIKDISGRTIDHKNSMEIYKSIKKWWYLNKKNGTNPVTFESNDKEFSVTLQILPTEEVGLTGAIVPVNFHTQLLRKIKRKAMRYGELDLPYIIATTFRPSRLSAALPFMQGLIISTLYGMGNIINPSTGLLEKNSSLWNIDRKKKTYGNVSGVMFFDELTIYRALNPFKYCLFINHFAYNPIYENISSVFNIYYIDDANQNRGDGIIISDIFNSCVK